MSAVEIVRAGVVESRHEVHIAVCDASGSLIAETGEASGPTFYRSAAKPLQALPLVEEGIADRYSLTPAELALCCASHEGEAEHVEGVRSILAKAGVDESLLTCGPHAPFSQRSADALARDGVEPQRIHNNCSGKHAGMLALAVGMGWEPVDYHLPDHPVQRRMQAEIERWTGLPRVTIATGIDGCGVVCFAVPLDVMATSFARFADAARSEEPVSRIVAAMTSHPFMVGGTGRTCTDVMEVGRGAVFVKLGAEGVYAGGVPERGLGFAIKVADGGRRAVEVALVHTLAELGVLASIQVEALAQHGRPDQTNTRGEVVGSIRPAISLSSPAAARA